MGKKKGAKMGAGGESPAQSPAKAPTAAATTGEPKSPTPAVASGAAGGSGEPAARARGGFKSMELITIPQGVSVVSTGGQGPGKSIEVMSNFITIKPMKQQPIYSYRVDFEPNLENSEVKSRLFYRATRELLLKDVIFDGAFEARSSLKTREQVTHLKVGPTREVETIFTVTLQLVGSVTPKTPEMLRVYNTHVKQFLREMKFCRLGGKGGFVDPTMSTDVPNTNLTVMRGFRTAINLHDQDKILMSLEPNQKIIQKKTVLELIKDIFRNVRGDWQSSASAEFEGKLIITSYDRNVYRIEGIDYKKNPESKFTLDKTGQEISFSEYFKQRYSIKINDLKQPLLLAVPNNKRSYQAGEKERERFFIPELCLLTGLTSSQNNDFSVKTAMIRASQIMPGDRVKHINEFLNRLQSNESVKAKLAAWGYSYDSLPTKLKARVMPMERVGDGRSSWFPAEAETGSFEKIVLNKSLGKTPTLASLVILIPKNLTRPGPGGVGDINNEILRILSQGFSKIGLKLATGRPTVIDLPNDRADSYIQAIQKLPPTTTATIIVMNRQQKSTYDAIKKEASVQRALITQVVTAKLLLDSRKSGGATVKIAIQIAAKIGGEPWFLSMPTKGDMICGYDTYHDTANAGRSFGAFIASMNDTHSRWLSRADEHDRKSEISPHMPTNASEAMKRYQKLNNVFPKRVIIYRDGVGESQIQEVLKTEIQQVLKSIRKVNKSTQLTFVIVSKRIGARFYQMDRGAFKNPEPGSVIDTVVTRSSRYDFYLISQHTKFGTVTPTYYNIIYDESKISPADHQSLAYKLCFLYYNWAGTVRVPAPCQYAHKLAILCGEHLHRVPNDNLADRLHYL